MPRLERKTALITGGNSGIGLATAKAFVAEGARVAITGRDSTTLARAAKELGVDTLAIRTDVANLRELDDLCEQIRARFGALDILFANAGLSVPTPLGATTEEDFDKIFDTKVLSPPGCKLAAQKVSSS